MNRSDEEGEGKGYREERREMGKRLGKEEKRKEVLGSFVQHIHLPSKTACTSALEKEGTREKELRKGGE